MKLIVVAILTFSFFAVGCGSKKKNNRSSVAVAGQLPDHDFKIHQPGDTEIMIMIDSRGRAKQIPDEWSVDTTAHKPYVSSKRVVAKKYKKKKRRPASTKKKSKKKKRKKKSRKKR